MENLLEKEPEVFVSVNGSNGMYEISNYGTVISNNHMNSGDRKEVIPHKDHKGYMRLRLMIDGKRGTFKIHRLVALHFIDNPESKPMVNHKDLDKANNYFKNLEWSTAKENTHHAIENNAFYFKRTLTVEQVIAIRADYKPRKNTAKHLSEKYGVSIGCIMGVIYRLNWKNI